jgi:hypothetical protein
VSSGEFCRILNFFNVESSGFGGLGVWELGGKRVSVATHPAGHAVYLGNFLFHKSSSY